MKRIVIVDDSSMARMVSQKCLEILGLSEATFFKAENGQEALLLLKNQSADLVMSDLNMPVMDGERLLKRIKASPRLNDIPVVMVTSVGNPAKEKELLELGALAVINKPVSPAALNASIGALIEEWMGSNE